MEKQHLYLEATLRHNKLHLEFAALILTLKYLFHTIAMAVACNCCSEYGSLGAHLRLFFFVPFIVVNQRLHLEAAIFAQQVSRPEFVA